MADVIFRKQISIFVPLSDWKAIRREGGFPARTEQPNRSYLARFSTFGAESRPSFGNLLV